MAATQKKPVTKQKEKKAEPANEKTKTVPSTIPEVKSDSVEGDYNDLVKRDPAVFLPLEYKPNGKTVCEELKESLIEYKKETRLPSLISTIMMFLSSGFVFASMVILFIKVDEKNPIKIILFVITAVLLVAAFVFSRIFSKKKTTLTTDYLKKYENIVNGETLSRLNVKEAKLSVAGKIDDQDVIRTHYFATINDIHSRGITEGKRNNKGIRCGELAILVPPVSFQDANKLPTNYIDLEGKPVEVTNPEIILPTASPSSVLFKKQRETNETYFGIYGKLFSYDLIVDSNESIIIAFRGDVKSTFLPNYLTGFEAIKVKGLNDNIVVYAIDIQKSKKFFDKQGVDLLNKISPNDDFLSGFITANSYGVRVGLNLSERLMQLPLDEKSLNQNGFDNFFQTTKDMFAYVDFIEKKLK